MKHLEVLILKNLLYNETYLRKVLPFLKDEYFKTASERKTLGAIRTFVEDYNAPPSVDALSIVFQNDTSLEEAEFSDIETVLEELKDRPETNTDWLIQESEKFCQDRSIYLALMQSIQIANGDDKTLNSDAIPAIMTEALSVGFGSNLGHDYIDDADDRFAYYHNEETRIPSGLEMFDKICSGGLPPKTLTIFMSGIHAGKTATMCDLASKYLKLGKNVMYITLEMSREEIGRRIDTNLLNIPIYDMDTVSKSIFTERIEKLNNTTTGKLKVFEYPELSLHCGHIRALLSDLKMKQNFTPDIVIVDYLNLLASSRYKNNGVVSSYEYVKSVSHELRGLMKEKGFVGISATQSTRAGSTKSDAGMSDVSESFGVPASADLMIHLFADDNMKALNQVLWVQLKNRFRDLSRDTRFVVGFDRKFMRLYNVEQNAQKTLDQGQFPSTPEAPKMITSGRWKETKFGSIKR